jgi:hypothetical protein
VEGPAQLDVDRGGAVDLDAVCRALADPSWLGPIVDVSAARDDMRRFESDLAFSVDAGQRLLTFRKAAFIDVGRVSSTADGCSIIVAWQSASLAPLFPIFAGLVSADREGLHLRGAYEPPGGGIGVVIDRAFMHYFAKRTATWFLDRLAEEAAEHA